MSPRPSVFHVALVEANLATLKSIVNRDGMDQSSIAHIKGYSGELGLFWFHGFCDECDDTLFCSQHVDEVTIEKLESRFGLKAEKKFGELKSDRELADELQRLADVMERYQRAGKAEQEAILNGVNIAPDEDESTDTPPSVN